MTKNNNRQLNATVELGEAVVSTITDYNNETHVLLMPLSDEQRRQMVLDAYRVGMRAIGGAYVEARESRLQDIGADLLDTMDSQLEEYTKAQVEKLGVVLGTYFDPKDGKLGERLDAFVKDGGEISNLLKVHLAPENSVLAQTLATKVGENSPLFKLLSPTESDGVIKQMEAKVKEALDGCQTSVADALNPRLENSPAHLFLKDLQEDMAQNEEDRAAQLDALTKQLDANDEDSLLSRLVRQTNQAQRELRDAINPELPDSPMGIIRTTLQKTLTAAHGEQRELLETMKVDLAQFQQEVREAVQRIELQHEARTKGLEGGHSFQHTVFEFMNAVLGGTAMLTLEDTGASVGLIKACKVGDAVLRFTAESAYEGAGVVVEAKHDGSYTVAAALEEIGKARKNRDCQVGLFVMAQTHAKKGFPLLQRYGNDILMTWDQRDPGAACYLHAALLLSLGLASRQTVDDRGDIHAIADLGGRLEQEVKRLDGMNKLADNISRDAGKMSHQIRVGKDKLRLAINNVHSSLLALDIQARDYKAEVASPIGLPEGSLESGRERLVLLSSNENEVTLDVEGVETEPSGTEGRE